MKKKVKIKIFNDEKEFEINIRDQDFVNIVIKNPSTVYKNKKAYTRKIKHKNRGEY